MTLEQFLTAILFKDLDYKVTEEGVQVFSSDAFREVIERSMKNGVGIYRVLVWKNDEVEEILTHEQFLKKATDLRWAKTAYFKFSREDATYEFSGEFKVSEKLLERAALFVPKVKKKDEEEE
ncbi:hypothetical protein CW736_00370 [Nonlabens sp. MB-3u-79]|jgi:hypothetical protein|uniref:hypothetical protein n=1 Tax=Nonlabens sp. MB-3u-79 TaxID=2058134 RepID=UPI000C302564|nr:hypothetical protein [Nonlabens sp. MB-3u-79]AUC77955.1 hypothetical protein CW736_00370 [Nonlabens sp. MB-3u-79]|tara:strand:+ start:13006 stop:13371 length:366 start_codon:yes stop_codon:yes gene_type:complete